MLPRVEVTLDITWDEKPAGAMSSFSPNLQAILDKPFSSDPKDTFMRSIGNTIMTALEQQYPNIVFARMVMSCRVMVKKE